MEAIKKIWVDNISDTVVDSILIKELDKLFAQGIDSGYLIFVLKYIIKHGKNLRYPAGLKYYIDDSDIKQEYKNVQARRNKIDMQSFNVEDAFANDTQMANTISIGRKDEGIMGIFGKR